MSAWVSRYKTEALAIKERLASFFREDLKLTLSEEKTLITHAREEKAHFLGYQLHVLHADSKHDHRGQRCINGSVGFCVPASVTKAHCTKYQRKGKPIHLTQRVQDDAYSIVTQYQAEYRGVVGYYRMAYNLHTLGRLRHVTEVSLVKTLVKKFKTTCRQIYHQYGTRLQLKEGIYKVLEIRRERAGKKPLITHFGGVPLRRNQWVRLDDDLSDSWVCSRRSEVIERLLAQECELCGAKDQIEVQFANFQTYSNQAVPRNWIGNEDECPATQNTNSLPAMSSKNPVWTL